MLEIRNLHVNAENKEILRGINLTVNSGEIHSIMGPNGSGKSTLAQVLAGREIFRGHRRGDSSIRRQDLLEMAPEDRAREGMFHRFSVSGRDTAVSATRTFLRTAAQRHSQASRP
jgi:Fe-S cluster assembly ATP-binding protein